MSDVFDAEWLSLREAVDHDSRAPGLVQTLREWSASRAELQILDLGAGTGSNLRFLAPRLTVAQHWTLLDHDSDLLARVHPPLHPEPLTLRTVCANLSQWRDHATDPAPELVTASALIDLVSATWLDSLVRGCNALGATVYIALSYDGQVRWTSTDPLDSDVLAGVNAHQARDKGLGNALGPAATGLLAEGLTALGYSVQVEPSIWNLGVEAIPLARRLIDGWVHAACAQQPQRCTEFRDWGQRRSADIRARRTRVEVGHRDLLGLPGIDR